MSRGFSDCCHYDEGYDDGYEDAKRKNALGAVPVFAVAHALRIYARGLNMRFQFEDADAAERIADEIVRDAWVGVALEREAEGSEVAA